MGRPDAGQQLPLHDSFAVSPAAASRSPVGADAKLLLELNVEAGVPQVGHRKLEWLGIWLHVRAARCSRRCQMRSCLVRCCRRRHCAERWQLSRQQRACRPCCFCCCMVAALRAIELLWLMPWLLLLLHDDAALLKRRRALLKGAVPTLPAVHRQCWFCRRRGCHQAALPGHIAVRQA